MKNYLKYNETDDEAAETNLMEIAKKLTIEKYVHDEYIFRQDDEGFKFYIVLSGTVIGFIENSKYFQQGSAVVTTNKEVVRLNEGQSFGEMALISGASRSLSMKAYNDVTLIVLHKDDYLKCFGDKISDKIIEIKDFLSKSKSFSHMDTKDIRTLASKLVVKNISTSQKICDQGEICRTLHILKNGQISILRVIHKSKINSDNLQPVLREVFETIPEEVEVEVKTKYNPGDLILLHEVMSGYPSRYRVRAAIPSQLYVVTIFDLKRYIGLEKFNKMPDADYFQSSDEDLLKYHLEKVAWKGYRSKMVNDEIKQREKAKYYLKSSDRLNNKILSCKPTHFDERANQYFQTKEQFFEEPEVKQPIKLSKRLLVESYKNEMDDDHISNILKYQCKKIISSAFDDVKSNKEVRKRKLVIGNRAKSMAMIKTSLGLGLKKKSFTSLKPFWNESVGISQTKNLVQLGKLIQKYSPNKLAS